MAPIILPTTVEGVGRPLSELQSAVQLKGGFYTDTADVQTAAINECYRELGQYRDWWWLTGRAEGDLTLGDSAVTTPLDLRDRSVVDVQVQDTAGAWTSLTPVTPSRYQREAALQPSNGLPDIWSWLAAPGVAGTEVAIHVLPAPERVYQGLVEYELAIVELAEPTDRPLVPESHQDVLVWGAITDLAARQRDWQLYDRAKAKYDELKLLMIYDDARWRHQAGDTGRVADSGTFSGLEVAGQWLS